MSVSVTIRIDEATARALDRVAAEAGRTRSDVLREALQRQLEVARFDRLRQRIAPLAEARGWLTDEDVFDDVS
jgi:predicted transcriptional regulator